jgi:hypothetical protein
VCRFTPPTTWQPIFASDPLDRIEIRALTGGLTLVKGDGRQGTGSLFLVQQDGRILARYDLLSEAPLEEVISESSRGPTLLCNTDAQSNTWCDTWWNVNAAKLPAASDFPDHCGWPRFLPDGSGVCWDRSGMTLEFQPAPSGFPFFRRMLPAAGTAVALRDVHPLARNCIVLDIDGKLTVWDGLTFRAIETPPVTDSRQVGKRVYFTACTRKDVQPHGCGLWWMDQGLAIHRIWSTPLVPHRFQVMDDSSVLVDEWLGGIRRIIRVGPGKDHETVLWSENDPVWK